MAERAATAASRQGREGYKTGDPWIIISALCLTGIGLVMVLSASSALAGKRYLDSAYFFKHQLFHLAVALLVMSFFAFRDYQRLKGLAYPAVFIVLIGLILVLIPQVGHRAGGAARWLRLGPVSLQPSEFAKLALVLYMAYSLSEHQHQIKSLSRGFLPHIGMAGMLTLPVLLEPDLGMSLTLMALAVIMLFVAGTRFTYLVGLAAAAVPVLYLLISTASYRLHRLTGFLSPWDDPRDTGFQIIHSFLAFGSGGLWGTGLGQSKQKLFYLPEPHTDFIFSVLGEELGLWGVYLVLILFFVLIWRGLRTALDARDLFGTYLALGATLIIGLQAFVNAAVVMGLAPTKGLTLPFISYGGSSLVTNFACVGLLLSVASHQAKAGRGS
ncbi:MAG: putative lipid II flippase FtsW [Desulfarculaceae bacterium]|jgi:cell division protein FtsW